MKTRINEVKRPAEHMWDDVVNYISERILLSINATEEKDIIDETKNYVDSTLFLLVGDKNIKETIQRIISIDDLREEFINKFGERYECGCAKCGDKTDKKCGGC